MTPKTNQSEQDRLRLAAALLWRFNRATRLLRSVARGHESNRQRAERAAAQLADALAAVKGEINA